MTFNGNDSKTYGLVPVRHEGFYDMPARVSPYYYDWGDTLQPLLDVSDIGWLNLVYKVSFLFDARVGGTGTIDGRVQAISALDPFTLVLTESGSGYGTYVVKPDFFNRHRKYRNNDTIDLTFYDREPVFVGAIPSAPGTLKATSLGGRNFDQFGITVTKVVDKSATGVLKQSKETYFNKSPKKTNFRNFPTVKIECYCVGSSPNDLLQKMSHFRLLLQSPNTLTFTHGGDSFETFCSAGFKCNRVNSRTVKFNLILNRI